MPRRASPVRAALSSVRARARAAAAALPGARAGRPCVAGMGEVALRILARAPQGFILGAEEEGTDSFGNRNTASGVLEAGARADAVIGVFARFVRGNPRAPRPHAVVASSATPALISPIARTFCIPIDSPNTAQPMMAITT